jgi:protein O-GlcNAc transferase
MSQRGLAATALAEAAAHLAAHRYAEARGICDALLTAHPDDPEVLHVTGLVRFRQGDCETAIDLLSRSLELRPDSADVLANLGAMQEELGNDEAAFGCFAAAHDLAPQDISVLQRLGRTLFRLENYRGAEAAWRELLALTPQSALAYCELGYALRGQGRLDEALEAFRRATELDPNEAAAWNNFAVACQGYGQFRRAAEAHRRFLAVRPDAAATAYRNLMTVMLYSHEFSDAERWAVAREFETACAAPIAARARTSFAQSRDASRRLRVGYVSSDFYEHPVGRNLEPVLAHRDRARFEVICYAEVVRPDGLTARFQALADGWRPTTGLTDEQVAAQIRADQVDVLVILAGRFDRNRPLVAAYRAAPVQVSFHDPGTSGLQAMDYLIADRVLVPRQTAERFSERVVALPSFYIHGTLGGPEVGPLPAERNGYVTFGSFNNPAKVNDAVLGLWGEVLRAVPGARLKIKCKNWFANSGLQERFREKLGIAPDRIEFDMADRSIGDHLSLYNDVDVALDPFPFTGSTTTFEALWMGVPVVTLAGTNMAGRWSASMLSALRLHELVAATHEEYMAIARRLATDLPQLAAMRAALRQRVVASPLCNGRARARQLERLYRALWGRWCRQE